MRVIETFTAAKVREMKRPCVYQFIKNGKPLYIGSSLDKLVRVLSNSHHRSDVREQADEVRVEWLDDYERALHLEARLIRDLKPPYNKTVPSPTAWIRNWSKAAIHG